LDDLGMAGQAGADILVGGVLGVAAHVAGPDREHALGDTEDGLGTPEASAADGRGLGPRGFGPGSLVLSDGDRGAAGSTGGAPRNLAAGAIREHRQAAPMRRRRMRSDEGFRQRSGSPQGPRAIRTTRAISSATREGSSRGMSAPPVRAGT